jgi:hypothetical protein
MTPKKRPEKLKDVLAAIKESLKRRKYTITLHAFDRQVERAITLPMILNVLETGYEEKRKTIFDEDKYCWKYAIRGKAIRDGLDIRVIISIDESGVVIITVMYVEKKI